jgi:hypothetical protein
MVGAPVILGLAFFVILDATFPLDSGPVSLCDLRLLSMRCRLIMAFLDFLIA